MKLKQGSSCLCGAAAIGEEIGASPITVRRLARGVLKNLIFRTGTSTSPLRLLRAHIPEAHRRLRRQHAEHVG